MKKKLFLLVSMMTLAMGVHAQFSVGGSIGFTSTKLSNGAADQDGTSYQIMPEIGYQLDENTTVGIQLGYAHGFAAFGSLSTTDFINTVTNAISMSADISEDDIKMNSFSFAPFIRYNVLEIGRANIFVEGMVSYSSIKTDGSPAIGGLGGSKMTFNSFEVVARPGVSFQLSENLTALAKIGSLGYISAKEKESDMKITRYGLSADSYNLLLGLNFNF